MGCGLGRRVHGHAHIALLHLGKLEVLVGRYIGHVVLALHRRVARHPCLQWLLDHAHVDILLMSCSDLLLLLLEEFDLLLQSELFHCYILVMKVKVAGWRRRTHQRCQLRWTSAMGNVKPASRRTRHASLPLLGHDVLLLGDWETQS